jgi:streptogrisin C
MNRRRVITSVAVMVTMSAAAALSYPALATTTPASPSGSTGAGPVQLAPAMIAALQRDLHLTADQVGARIKKETWATRTVQTLKQTVGSAYAGAWLNTDASRLTVAVTDQAAATQVRAAGAQPAVVANSESQLAAVKQTLDRSEPKAAAAIPGWYVDVATNSVVVLAKSTSLQAAQKFVAQSGVPAGTVRVAATAENPHPLFDVRGGDAFFIDNVARCSIGFSVVGGFVSAGHCGQAGSTTAGFNQQAQGTFKASSFPGNDFSFVQVNTAWTPVGVVNNFAGQTLAVAGSDEAPVGASVCKFGSTSGASCGTIQAKNATVRYPEGTVTGLLRTNVCAEPGDSGGSLLAADQAQGVVSGGSGDCTVGGETFFQPINEILQANGLTLVTSAASGGASGTPTATPTAAPTTAPPAGNACNLQNGSNHRGSLQRAGAVQVQPNGGFFRTAAAGTNAACLRGPDNTNFDLFLQQFNGRRWQTVARAATASSSEQLTFSGAAGVYRYVVVSNGGSGTYALSITTP